MKLIIGNLLSLMAMASNAFSATRKTTKGILLTQNLSQLLYAGCAIVLGGYSAAVQNVVSIARNFSAIGKKRSKVLEWTLVAAGVVLGIAFNNLGIIGLLPVLGNLQYTLAIFRFTDNERAVKISFLISVVCYVVFNALILNFVGAVSDLVVIITTIVVLIKGQPGQGREEC
jgi:hypothetical protein